MRAHKKDQNQNKMKKIREFMQWWEDYRIRERIEDWIELQCQRLVEFLISITITGFVFFIMIACIYFYIGPENIR